MALYWFSQLLLCDIFKQFLNMNNGIILPSCLYQFYTVFLQYFHLPVSLDSLLLMTGFYLGELSQYLLFQLHPHWLPGPPQLPSHAPLSLSCSGTPSWNGPSCHTKHMSYHRPSIALVHASHHSICKGIIDLSCLACVSHYPVLA